MKDFDFECALGTTLLVLFGVAVILGFYGAYNAFNIMYQREQAQWQDAMDFAKRTGGHFECNHILYPDGRIVYLSQPTR